MGNWQSLFWKINGQLNKIYNKATNKKPIYLTNKWAWVDRGIQNKNTKHVLKLQSHLTAL